MTRRWGHEVDINSKVRDPNPQDYTTSSVLGKVVFNTFGAGQIRLTGEFFGKSVNTRLNSESGVFPDQFARIFDGVGDDTTTVGGPASIGTLPGDFMPEREGRWIVLPVSSIARYDREVGVAQARTGDFDHHLARSGVRLRHVLKLWLRLRLQKSVGKHLFRPCPSVVVAEFDAWRE